MLTFDDEAHKKIGIAKMIEINWKASSPENKHNAALASLCVSVKKCGDYTVIYSKQEIMKKYFALVLIILVGFCSCTKTENASIFNENINTEMFEDLDSTGRTLVFNCSTANCYDCLGYYIQSNCALTNNKIIINFVRIIAPDGICLDQPGPATASFSFVGLANGAYTIELSLGASSISGQLTVSTGSYKVTLPQQTRIQFVDTSFDRIPNNTIFGTVNYDTSSTAATVQGFIDSLQFYGATPAKLTQGNYLQFQIDSSGQIVQNQDPGYYFTRYFIFNYAGNSTPLKNLVHRYGINYPDSLLITVNTSEGETFYSWVQ